MKNLIKWIAIIFFSCVFALSSDDFLMKRIAPLRYDSYSIFSSDRYKYGDLFGFSYLKDFKISHDPYPVIISDCDEPKIINLYMICDSYLWSFVKTDSIFCGVNKLKYARWRYGETVSEELDPEKKNVLILEMSERFVRYLLADTSETYGSMTVYKPNAAHVNKLTRKTLFDKVGEYFFNPMVNENLEFNLFDYHLFSPLRELKAELNYRVFQRVDKEVAISSDKKNLFYKETVDSDKITSPFNYVSDKEVAEIISVANAEYNHFKHQGFDEIYLSLIPNPVTIIEPKMGVYNNLIDRIQLSNSLALKTINIYEIFKKVGPSAYSRSDTHWNTTGFQLWVDEVNQVFKKDLLK